MPGVVDLGPHRCLVLALQDRLATPADLSGLIGDALSEAASVIAIPIEALDPSFFDLRSGLAGEVLQKAANYGIKLAVLGDVTPHTTASRAFHDLVVESSRSTTFFFLPGLPELEQRLASLPTAH